MHLSRRENALRPCAHRGSGGAAPLLARLPHSPLHELYERQQRRVRVCVQGGCVVAVVPSHVPWQLLREGEGAAQREVCVQAWLHLCAGCVLASLLAAIQGPTRTKACAAE